MAEATLNAVNSASYLADGRVGCNCNITDPEGGIWDTDYVIYPDEPRPTGLTGAVYDWVIANPDQIAPYSEEAPPQPTDPVNENPAPETPPPGNTGGFPDPDLPPLTGDPPAPMGTEG